MKLLGKCLKWESMAGTEVIMVVIIVVIMVVTVEGESGVVAWSHGCRKVRGALSRHCLVPSLRTAEFGPCLFITHSNDRC